MNVLFTPGVLELPFQEKVRQAYPGKWSFRGARAPVTRDDEPLVACGFSAGGAMARDMVLSAPIGQSLTADDAIIIADGVHIREPAIPGATLMPRAPWQALVDRARRGEGPRVILSHTYLIYTDAMRDDPRTPIVERPYGSTATSIRMLTGWALEEPIGPRGVTERTEGRLTVISHESGDADAGAHGRQLTEHLLTMLRRLSAERSPTVATEEPTWRDPSLSLAHRLLAWCGGELARGVRESGGPNRGPRVDWYFQAAPFERAGKPLRIQGAAWCVAAVCAGLWACLLDGERSPLTARVSGIELEQDARATGRWVDGVQAAEPGWIMVDRRAGSDPAKAAWERHGAVVVSDDGAELVTVGGNELDTWKRTVRRVRPLGFVRV